MKITYHTGLHCIVEYRHSISLEQALDFILNKEGVIRSYHHDEQELIEYFRAVGSVQVVEVGYYTYLTKLGSNLRIDI